MGCGSIGDVGTVAGSNLVAVPHCGKKSRGVLEGRGYSSFQIHHQRWVSIILLHCYLSELCTLDV